jgi:hypothetical protein
MRLHERLGRAVRAGTVPGRRSRAVIWQITPDGAAWLASRALAALRDAQEAREARTHARDLGVAVERMVQFHAGPAQPASGDRSPARTTPPLTAAALPAGQWTVPSLAAELGMPIATLYDWIYRGQVAAVFGDRWVIHANTAELAKLRALRAQHPPPARSAAAARG